MEGERKTCEVVTLMLPPYSVTDPNGGEPPKYRKIDKGSKKLTTQTKRKGGCICMKRCCFVVCLITFIGVLFRGLYGLSVSGGQCGTESYETDDLFIICDGGLGTLYVHGQWTKVEDIGNRSIALLPMYGGVLAVHCANMSGATVGVWASSDHLVSDSHWKCTSQNENDWMMPHFNDSHWPAAVVKETNRQSPVDNENRMPRAKWIGSDSDSREVFCRTSVPTIISIA